MKRRHGLFLATALGLAAIAGTYAAMQTTDLGAQAATVSEQEIAAADLRLDKQEAALRRAARKRPPRLPKLPERVSASAGGGGAAAAPVSAPAASAAVPAAAPAAPAPAPPPSAAPVGHDDHDDDFEDDAADAYEDYLDDRADALEDAAEERHDDDD